MSTRERWFIASILLVAALLRIIIIWQGGQGFTPDESRYEDSRAATALLREGKIRAALTLPLNTGEHPGFKLAGIVPALVETFVGKSLRVPALFFGGFSLLTLWLILLAARRLGLSSVAQVWALLLAACSPPLLFYARHLYPYDLAMALALGGLVVALKPGAGAGRVLIAGVLCGAAFVSYLAYWIMAGMVMVLVTLWGGGWLAMARRAALLTVGFGLVLGAVWLLDQWGGGDLLVNSRKFSGSVYSPDFGNGFLLPWLYLKEAQGWLLSLLLLGALIAGTGVVLRQRSERAWTSPLTLLITAVGVTYGLMGLASEGCEMIPVTGRVVRLLVPFLCLLGGLVIERFLAGRSDRRIGAGVLAVLVIGAAAVPVSTILRQRFPADFRDEALALMGNLPPDGPDSYHRLVNVDHFFYEVETLPQEPAETLLAAPHPFQYKPYLYEGLTVEMRRQRQAADQRMRLVRMMVPETARVRGEDWGLIRMKVSFAAGRGGFSEPLLAVGGREEGGTLLFVRYLTDTRLVLGIEVVGQKVRQSEPIDFQPGREYALEFFAGQMLPPAHGGADQLSEGQRLEYQNYFQVKCEGRNVLDGMVLSPEAGSAQVYAGFNKVRATSAMTAFSGEIREVVRGGLPEVPEQTDETFGALRLVLRMTAAASGAPEPLAVVGVPGEANLVYLRVLPQGQARLGVEVWGYGAYESEPFAADSTKPLALEISLPVMFPPTGDPRWRGAGADLQQDLRSTFRLKANGAVVLVHPATGPVPRATRVHYARNPVGGSLVLGEFSGSVLQVERLPFP